VVEPVGSNTPQLHHQFAWSVVQASTLKKVFMLFENKILSISGNILTFLKQFIGRKKRTKKRTKKEQKTSRCGKTI